MHVRSPLLAPAGSLGIRQPSRHATASHDVPTVAAIAVIVYALSSLLHEGAGHGGACLLVNGAPIELSSMHFECSVFDDGSIQSRLVAAGGTIATLLGGGFALLLYNFSHGAAKWRYGLWLFAAVNLMQGTGYLLFSGVGNVGDWAMVIAGWEPAWLWRCAMAAVGLVFYFVVTMGVFRLLDGLVGDARPRRYRHALRLAVLAYVIGGGLEIAAGMRNPGGVRLLVISGAAAALGGASGLLWGPETLRGPTTPSDMLEIPVDIVERSWAVIALGVLCAAGFVVVFGKGLTFSS